MINKKKTFSILLIGIIAILTISMLGSVSAADQTITTASSGGLKTAIDNVGTGETVYIENGVYSGNNNIGITINKNLIISGKGNNVVIDAKGTNNIFVIEEKTQVTLKNLKIINGKDTSGYATIYNKGNLTISGCTFNNNKGHEGGAIHNSGYNKAILTVNGCTFTNNQASYGGAIYNSGGTLIVNGSTFSNNKATVGGGAIYDKTSKVTSRLGYINSNGVFVPYVTYNYGVITISSSTFNNNQAAYGGAIRADEDTVIKIDKTNFNNNIDTDTKTYNAIYYTGTKMSKTGVSITPKDGTKVNAGTANPGGTINQGSNTPTTKLADLKITKITKKANIRYVFVKNIGKASAGKNTLGVYIGKTLIKKVSVKPIGIGKTLRVTVSIPKKYMTKKNKDKVKTFKVDIRNVVKESNKKNNSFKAK